MKLEQEKRTTVRGW